MSGADLYKEITVPQALNPQSIVALNDQLSQFEKDKVRFIVLKGSDDCFCEGMDIKWIANNDPAAFVNDILSFSDLLKKLQTGNFISIAVAGGSVAGGGLGLLCACDHVIAEEGTVFSLPEGALGFVPGVIFPALLNRMSLSAIRRMFLTTQKYPAAKALEWGIADEVAAKDQLQQAIDNAIASMRACKPGAVGDFKTLLYRSQTDRGELPKEGMDLLIKKLLDPDIRERLISIADFME